MVNKKTNYSMYNSQHAFSNYFSLSRIFVYNWGLPITNPSNYACIKKQNDSTTNELAIKPKNTSDYTLVSYTYILYSLEVEDGYQMNHFEVVFPTVWVTVLFCFTLYFIYWI